MLLVVPGWVNLIHLLFQMFSPCSQSSIGAVLLAKGNCFQGDCVSLSHDHDTVCMPLSLTVSIDSHTVKNSLSLDCHMTIVVVMWHSAARSTVCGDYRIDENEECDAGPSGDACCNNVTMPGPCMLTQGSNCRYVPLSSSSSFHTFPSVPPFSCNSLNDICKILILKQL